MNFTNINILAVIVSTVAYYVLGGLWYSPFLFGNYWDRAIGFERPKKWKSPILSYIMPFIGCLVVSIAVALIMQLVHFASITNAIVFGIILGIGFSVSISMVNAVTPKMEKPIMYGLVTGIYHLVGTIIVILINYAWK
jgi:hypothetical protein